MKIISTLIGIVITAAIIWAGTSFYKSSIKDTVVIDLKTQTQTHEGEAIENALQINRAFSKLSDDDIESRLQFWGDYRTDDEPTSSPSSEQSERMPSLPYSPIIETRSPKIKTSSGEAQRSIPQSLLKQNCRIEYGFDEAGFIADFEVCEDEE